MCDIFNMPPPCHHKALVNMPPPCHHKALDNHVAALYETHEKAVAEQLQRTRDKVFSRHSCNESDVAEIAVSYDGTWSKRGYTANFGVDFVISVETGEVLDYDFESKLCILRDCWSLFSSVIMDIILNRSRRCSLNMSVNTMKNDSFAAQTTYRLFKKSLAFQGAKLWNSLNNDTRGETNFRTDF
jgi:hypothetical protein